MPLDTSSTSALINQLANPPNPFEQYGKTLNFAAGLRQFQANQAGADAYRQAVDPVTGALDMGKYNALMAAGPGAYNLGAAMQQAGQGVGAQGVAQQQDLAAKRQMLEAVGTQLAPLMAKIQVGQAVTKEEVQAALDQAKGLGLPATTINNMQRQIDAIPPGGTANNIVLGANFANSTGIQILGATNPGTAPQSTGGGTVFVAPGTLSPGRNVGPGTYLPHTLTPGEAAQPMNLTIGNQTVQVPLGAAAPLLAANPNLWNTLTPEQREILQRSGIQPPGGAASPPASAPSGGAAPKAAPPPGRYPPAPTAQLSSGTAPAPTTAPASDTAPYLQPPPQAPQRAPTGQLPSGGGFGVAPSPGVVETQKQQAQVSSQQLAALTGAMTESPGTKALLNDMRAQLEVPGWDPGMGAQAGSTWRQALDKLHIAGGSGSALNVKDAQAAQEEFNKDANLVATRQLAALGTNPTDARQQLAELTTPGLALSKEGNVGLTATLLGNQHALEAQSRAWEQAKQAGWGEDRYSDWLKNGWNGTDKASGGKFDPRVFWLADTPGTGDRQGKMLDKIPKEQRAQFLKNVQYAKKQGWIVGNSDGTVSVANP